jgi:hypothetical protein
LPVLPGEWSSQVAEVSGTSGVQTRLIGHSKSPLGTRAVGVGQEEEEVLVEGAAQVGPQEQAEEYRAGSVPQAEVARVGVVVVVALTAVRVRQKSVAEVSAAGLPHGKRAR